MSNLEKGGCLCGDFSYQFERDTVMSAHHCHCKDCQKMTGSGKATIVLLPTESLEMQGELKKYTVTGTDGATVTRGFCVNCGSQILSYIEEVPSMRIIKAGTLEDNSWVTIDSSFWTINAHSWSPADTSCPAFEKNPPSI